MKRKSGSRAIRGGDWEHTAAMWDQPVALAGNSRLVIGFSQLVPAAQAAGVMLPGVGEFLEFDCDLTITSALVASGTWNIGVGLHMSTYTFGTGWSVYDPVLAAAFPAARDDWLYQKASGLYVPVVPTNTGGSRILSFHWKGRRTIRQGVGPQLVIAASTVFPAGASLNMVLNAKYKLGKLI